MATPPRTLTNDEVRAFAKRVCWKFARTMPMYPHWYTMAKWMESEADRATLRDLAHTILERGESRVWDGDGRCRPRTNKYLDIDEHKYFIGYEIASLDEATLINRARLDDRGPAEGSP